VLDGTQLRAGVDTFFATRGAAGVIDTVGWYTQSLTRARDGGRDSWLQVFQWHDRDGSELTDSLVMDVASLRPVHELRVSRVGRVAVNYDGARVRASVVPVRGPTQSEDTTFAMPVFSSVSMDAIARAMPRKANYSAQFELYYLFPTPWRIRTSRLTVSGTATVPSQDHRDIECWVVVLEGPAVRVTKFWVEKGTGAIVQIADGEGDTRTLYLRPGAPAT
jgi:hypothetical protein